MNSIPGSEREPDLWVPGGPFAWSGCLEADIAALAELQHGVVALSQLVPLGLSRRAVAKRTDAGRLHRVHRGVYAVGHRKLSKVGLRMAAILMGGPGTVLSHRPAGDEWGLRSWNGRIATTVPSWRRERDGVMVHCSRVRDDERTVLDGLPITTVPRTILDLAAVLDDDALERALAEAEKRELGDALSLPAIVERHRGERGVGRLRVALGSETTGLGTTESELEERFIVLIRAAGLPHPELNAWLHLDGRSLRVDCLWRRQRIVVELLGARHHSGRRVTRDTARNRLLTLAGYTLIEVTWPQLHDAVERAALTRDLVRALSIR